MHFHSEGTSLFFSKRKCIGGVSKAVKDFETKGPILSVPDALVVCRVLNTLNTSVGLRDISHKMGLQTFN